MINCNTIRVRKPRQGANNSDDNNNKKNWLTKVTSREVRGRGRTDGSWLRSEEELSIFLFWLFSQGKERVGWQCQWLSWIGERRMN